MQNFHRSGTLNDMEIPEQNVLCPKGLNWVQHLVCSLFTHMTWFKNKHFSDADEDWADLGKSSS